MARRDAAKQAEETLQEIDSVFDRVADWVTHNPTPVLGSIGVVLVVAAGIGVADWRSQVSADEAAASVARVQTAYIEAMGGTPGSFDVPEPANPETAREVRQEYVKQFLVVADEHPGSVASVSALVEAGILQEQAGDDEAALATWERARGEAPRSSGLEGLVLQRLGHAYENAGRTQEAAEAYREAGSIEELPVQRLALADAARCLADLGDVAGALEILDQLEAEPPEPATGIVANLFARLGIQPDRGLLGPDPPDHVMARLRELRAAQPGANDG